MQKDPSANKKPANWFWPAVDTIDAAKDAAKQGAYTAAIVAGIIALFAILSLFGVEISSIWALVDASLFVLIAFGIVRMSRVAAVMGLLLYLWEQLGQFLDSGRTNWFLVFLFTLMFIGGIRGTFAYHNLKKLQPEPAAEEI